MKEDKITMQGVVMDSSKGVFRIKLENDHEVIGHLSGKMKKYTIRVLVGDEVTVELSPYDLNRCRIVERKKIDPNKNFTKKELKHKQYKKK